MTSPRSGPASPLPGAPAGDLHASLADHIPVQVWTARPDGQLDYVTEQTARDFGVTTEELLLNGWKDVVHPDDLPIAVERWTHALSTGETYEVEFRLKMADGTYACHLARAVVQRGEDGAIARWIGTNTNIEAQREERRRVQALLDQVTLQSRETAAALSSLKEANAAAHARIVALEGQLGR